MLLEVSRAASYAHRTGIPSARQRTDDELTERIRQAHQASKGRYGAPRVHAELRRCGHRHARKRVARLMGAAGLCGRRPRRSKRTTIPDPAAAARADLVRRDFSVNAAAVNTRWGGDGGLTSQERQELAGLRRENQRLRQDVEILKRATAFFVQETR